MSYNAVRITFVSLPSVDDHLFVKYSTPFGPGGRIETIFKAPGDTLILFQCHVGTDVPNQATLYYNAVVVADNDVLPMSEVSKSGNTITFILNFPAGFYDMVAPEISGPFATYELLNLSPSDVTLITSPYTEFAFTLDNLFYNLTGTVDGSYIELQTNMIAYGFFDDTLREKDVIDKVLLFNRNAKFNIGKRIHEFANKLSGLNSNFYQFKPLEVVITAVEKLLANDYIVNSQTLPLQLFVPGLSFQNFTLPKVLDINPHPERATINSKEKITLLLPAGTFYFAILKNGNYVSHEDMVIDQVGVYSKNVDFEDYTQGDTISFGVFNIDPSELDAAALAYKAFRIFPITSRYSKMLYWENDFHTTSALECTGEAFIKPEFNSIEWERVVDLVKTIQVLKINTNQVLMINTGFLLKTDSNKLGSLLRSRRIWLQYNNNTIQLVNKTKSLVSSDDKTPLYSYDLEFAINKEYDEKIYNV